MVGILLAPTDAALGQAVVTLPDLPSRIRQGLNVESGLNDGICVPLLLIALAAAETQADITTQSHATTVVVEEIGYGVARRRRRGRSSGRRSSSSRAAGS